MPILFASNLHVEVGVVATKATSESSSNVDFALHTIAPANLGVTKTG